MNAASTTYYKVLGVSRTANESQIRAAYKSEVVKAHPDKPGGSTQRFKEVQTAYEVLKDHGKRKEYDEEVQRQKVAKFFKRPPPLEFVKCPVTVALMDDKPYVFETAPDKLRCRFRHGDIISFEGATGCFVGLGAYDTFYWVKESSPYAVRLFSFGGGEERLIEVVLRATAPVRRASSLAPRSPGPSRMSSFRQDSFDSSTASFSATTGPSSPKPRPVSRNPPAPAPAPATTSASRERDDKLRKLREDILKTEHQRVWGAKTTRIVLDETSQRKKIQERAEEDYAALVQQMEKVVLAGRAARRRVSAATGGVRSMTPGQPQQRSVVQPAQTPVRVVERSPMRRTTPIIAASSQRTTTSPMRPPVSPLRRASAMTPSSSSTAQHRDPLLQPPSPLLFAAAGLDSTAKAGSSQQGTVMTPRRTLSSTRAAFGGSRTAVLTTQEAGTALPFPKEAAPLLRRASSSLGPSRR